VEGSYFIFSINSAFSCAIVVDFIGAAVIGTSKIVGEKIKIKLLVQSQYSCFANVIKCILYLFDSLQNKTNE
jgi:hypothetical protein